MQCWTEGGAQWLACTRDHCGAHLIGVTGSDTVSFSSISISSGNVGLLLSPVGINPGS
jgi:hypothetical protein